jgi:hypothetical protein
MLMIGTNDVFSSDTAATMTQELSGLIDRITQFSPDLKLLIASIPPIRPEAGADRVQKARDYNSQIPSLITRKQANGQRVEWVDMSSLTLNDISPASVDPGVHPTYDGYRKIANLWYNALSTIGTAQGTYAVDQDTLVEIENLVGSDFNDVLSGDAGENILEGADTFFYRTPAEGTDLITDFGSDDVFRISAAGFGAGLAAGVGLSATATSTGVLVNGETALSRDPTFLYYNGNLWFDADGTGAGERVAMARLTNLPDRLNLNQFIIST